MVRGPSEHLWVAIVASLMGHAGVVILSAQVLGNLVAEQADGRAPREHSRDHQPLVFVEVPLDRSSERLREATPEPLPEATPDRLAVSDPLPPAPPPPLLKPIPPTVPPVLVEPMDERLRLGVDDAERAGKTWLGFRDPAPHAAPKSLVEQPALDPMPGEPRELAHATDAAEATETSPPSRVDPAPAPVPEGPPLDLPPVPELPEPTKRVEASADERSSPPSNARQPLEGAFDAVKRPLPDGTLQTEPARPAQDASTQGFVGPVVPGAAPVDGEAESSSGGDPVPLAVRTTNRAAGVPGAAETKPAVSRVEPPAAPVAQQRPATAPPEPPTAQVSPGPGQRAIASPAPASNAGAEGEALGAESDKQSDASGKEDPIEIVLGRPAAAEGLDIVTRRPDFSRVTRVTARPNNPIVRVTFGPTGRVVYAEIVRSSGYDDVDSPLLNALYQWHARGPRLATLPKADPRKPNNPRDPQAGITVSFTILFR
jgi:hypothetical protein